MTADDEAGAAPQRRASKSLAHTGSSEAKGGKELWKMAKQKVMREHLVAFTRVRAAHGRAPPSDEDRTPEFRALEVRVDGEAGTVFDTVRVSSKAPASLELDKDGTIHCMLEDTSEDPKLRDARLRQAAVAKLSLDTDPVEANKVGLFKVTSDQLERVDIVGSTITFYLRPGVRAQGADTDGIAAFQVVCTQTFTAARFSRGLIALFKRKGTHAATSSGRDGYKDWSNHTCVWIICKSLTKRYEDRSVAGRINYDKLLRGCPAVSDVRPAECTPYPETLRNALHGASSKSGQTQHIQKSVTFP